MTDYRGTPASSQIIWLEGEVQRLQELFKIQSKTHAEHIKGLKAMEDKEHEMLSEEIKRLRRYEQLVQFIANDYWELSHDKIKWLYVEYKKRCSKLIEEDHNG